MNVEKRFLVIFVVSVIYQFTTTDALGGFLADLFTKIFQPDNEKPKVAHDVAVNVVTDELPISRCSNKNKELLSDIKLTVSPKPLNIQEGKTVIVSASLRLNEPLGKDTKVTAMVKQKHEYFFDVPVPCLRIPGTHLQIGSCTYELPLLLKFLQKRDPNLGTIELPLQPGVYETTVRLDVPESVMKIWRGPWAVFASGTYSVKVVLEDMENAPLDCFDTEFDVINEDVDNVEGKE